MRNAIPTTPDASTARTIARGMTRCGSLRLLGQVAGRLEAHDGVGAEQRGQHERAEPGVVAGRRDGPGRGQVGPVPEATDRGHHDQQHGQAEDPDQLGRDGGVVDPGGHPGRPDDQRGLEHQHHERLQRRAGRRVRLADQRLERDLDQPVVHRHGDDRQERERHPAQPPADVHVGQPGGPLVGVAGQRHPRGERAVDQGDQRLADDHDRPGPDRPRPAGAQRERERGEDPGGDRDERERHGERLEVPQRAHELLPVAEPGEYGVVVVLGEGGHLLITSSAARSRAAVLGPLWGGGQPRPPAGRGHLRLLRDRGPGAA